ncbi:hypothetical protein CBR_g74514 [Chara braunii]|uniref:Uncharacterized protein n=1 Tax=Chara braunii TaxID=69332 RepID=A0A388JJT6_CHABU|nr:hypothetical protein CBR_g74514 [Chara braunii]|eukprot:GBG41542.1 hypothetical protein CBR_g74514 [Chara braunii]
MTGEGMETSLHGGLRGTPLGPQVEEEVFAQTVVMTYKQQLEEMYTVLCQANGDLPCDVLLEGLETYDRWDDELYDLISFRQQDVDDRARAMAVFYDCVDILQQVKDIFAVRLATSRACAPPDTDVRTASTPPTTSITPLTTPISSTAITAALISTTVTLPVVNTVLLPTPVTAVTASPIASSTRLPSSATMVPIVATQTGAASPALSIATSTPMISLSIEMAPSNCPGCVCQRELFVPGSDARGLEEGPPSYVAFADLPRSKVLITCGCKTLEEGQGFGGKCDVRVSADGFWASSGTVGDAPRKGVIRPNINNNNCNTVCTDDTSNQIAADIRGGVTGICLFFIPSSFWSTVGDDWGQEREGWGVVVLRAQEGEAGMREVGGGREGVG